MLRSSSSSLQLMPSLAHLDWSNFCLVPFLSLSIPLQWPSVRNPEQCKTSKPERRHGGLLYHGVLGISRWLSKLKRSLPFCRWPSSAARQVLASVHSQSYQTELHFFESWSMVVVSMTPAYRGRKQEGRPHAVLFLPLCAPWVVHIMDCKYSLHGWFPEKKNQNKQKLHSKSSPK